jgi:hypothetical protein
MKMAIKKSRANQIIREELSLAIRENSEMTDMLSEGFWGDIAIQGGKAIGIALLQQMMSSKTGRNNLADIIEALPEFIKTHICDVGDIIREEFELEGRGFIIAAKALSMVCRTFVTINPIFAIMYAVAFVLRKMSDKSAQRVIDEAGKITVPSREEEESEEQNDAPGEDGLPRDDTPERSAEAAQESRKRDTLRYLGIIRENDFIKR